MSVLALPAAVAIGLPPPAQWHSHRDVGVWVVRILTSGVAFLFLSFAVGRISEGLARDTGGVALVTFALGTIVGALAATTFGHVTAGAFCFASFVLAWRRRHVLAGLLAGLALTVEYQTGLIALILGIYVAVHGLRPLTRYVGGLLPGCLLLATYNWLAFGSPLHLSYRYVANKYARDQSAGLFGISLPRWHPTEQVLVGDRGLLISSPVVVVALLGLLLLMRRHRAEAAACVTIVFAFVALSAGYFLPYGGVSPGPRFLVPALPFLAVGLGPAFRRLPFTAALLAAASLIASTAVALTWSWEGLVGYRQSVWGELARLVTGASSRLKPDLASNILTFTGISRPLAAAFVAGCTLLGFATAITVLVSARKTQPGLDTRR